MRLALAGGRVHGWAAGAPAAGARAAQLRAPRLRCGRLRARSPGPARRPAVRPVRAQAFRTGDFRTSRALVRLAADPGPVSLARVSCGERRLVVLVREGVWGVRDFDPDSAARRTFRGIAATPYDPRWSVPGRRTPYGADRTVRVPNADGRKRALGLGGEPAFAPAGQELTLQVTVQGDGSPWAVFADATSGNSSCRFRFLQPAALDADGRTTVDFNRALLPPCAFADHYVCPFPPPGNALGRGRCGGSGTWSGNRI
ncbi:DUF1684 domain-containing protein [Streptomyces sp. TRM68367]|nr:DUF1684 domain-containing protein [Streptomyces sp. TRM68367]